MATEDYSPIIKVEYDDAGNGFAAATDVGEIKDDSEHSPSLHEDETNTRGEIMYAGEVDQYNINCYDTSQRAGLLSKWKSDARVDYRLTRQDGSTVEVLDCKPRVGPIQNPLSAGARSYFQLVIFKNID